RSRVMHSRRDLPSFPTRRSSELGEGGMAGASISVFDTETMQSYFMGGKDEYTSAWLTAKDGVENTELVEQAEPLTPKAYETLTRSEEHTSELQSRENLVCRLLPE